MRLIRPTGDVAAGRCALSYSRTNIGDADLTNVLVVDDTCATVTGPTGDNGDGILNPDEVWTYTCDTSISTETTNTATVLSVTALVRAPMR